MRIAKNGADIISSVADHANRQILNILDSLAENKKQKEVQAQATEIAGNYGKAIANAVSNPIKGGQVVEAAELTELEKLFNRLEEKGKTVINWADDELEVVLYKGKQHDYFRSRDGKIFRVRYSKDDNLNKTLKQISEEYAARGIVVPEMEIVKINGKRGVASRLLTDLRDKSEDPHAVYMSFGTDVLFGHRNAYAKGVTMLNQKGQVVKVSTSGSANYRVRGEKRYDFGKEPTELRTFLDPAINKESAEFLKDMTREEMIKSIGIAVTDRYPSYLPGVDYKDNVLPARREFLKNFLNRAMQMEQKDGESLLQYVDRVSAKIKEVDQENAHYTQKLKEYVESFPVAHQFDWNGFRQKDKDDVLKLVESIQGLNDIPKAMYMRRFSADDFKKLVELCNKKDRFYFVDPEILSRFIYNPNKTVQLSIDDLYRYSRHYCNEYCSNAIDGMKSMEMRKSILDKYERGEISFDDVVNYIGMFRSHWANLNKRNLFEPIAGMSKPLRSDIATGLARLDDEKFAKAVTRTELFEGIPNRSKPLTDFISGLSTIEDDVYQKLLSRHLLEDLEPGNHKQLFKFDDAVALAKLDDETYQTVLNRDLLRVRPEYESTLDEHGWTKEWGSQLASSEIAGLAKLSDAQYSRLVRNGLFSPKYRDYFERLELYKTSEFVDSDFDVFRRMGILDNGQLDMKQWKAETIKELLALSKEEQANIPMLRSLEIPVYTKKYYSSDEMELNYVPIAKGDLAQYAKLPALNLDRFRAILRNKPLAERLAKTNNLFAAASCDEAAWNKILERGILSENSPFPKDFSISGTVCDFEEEEVGGKYVLNLLGKISDEKWAMLKKKGFINGDPNRPQFKGDDLYRISQLSDEEFSKLMRTGLCDNNFNFKYDPDVDGNGLLNYGDFVNPRWLMETLNQLSPEEIDIAAKRGIFKGYKVGDKVYRDRYYDLKLLQSQIALTDKQFANFMKMFEREPERGRLKMAALAKLPDEQIQRIVDRYLVQYGEYYEGADDYKAGIDIVARLSELNDREWEFARRLFNCDSLTGFESMVYGPAKTLSKLADFANGRKFLYEFSLKEKKELLATLIKTGGKECSDSSIASLLPQGTIIPKTFYKRQLILNEIIDSIGLSSKKLTDIEIADFKNLLGKISKSDSAIMKTDFDKMTYPPRLLYTRQKFEADVMNKVKDLDLVERRKLFEYFGFEIEQTKDGLKMFGYPSIPTSAKKAELLDDPKTKHLAEQLKLNVDKFVNGNKIICDDNPALEAELNNIAKAFPEFLTTVGKVQHGTHDFTVDVHTLKVLQGVMSDPRYQKLSDRDKMIMQLSTILHDITKTEKAVDKAHPADSAFDAYYLLDRLNLSREDKLKCYEIIRNHDWLEKVNKPVIDKITGERRPLTDRERNRIMQQIAFAHRQNDCFQMSAILTKADLKGVQRNNKFFNRFENAYETNVKAIQELINKLKTTAIHIPQTKIPKASEIKIDGEIAKSVTSDGITNTVLYLKPGQDLSRIGFDKGVVSDELNFLVHALDFEEQSSVFKALGFVDSDALLSSSWINYQKGNYKVFRQQGYILKVDSDDIHAGSYKDFGSGYKKDYNTLLKEYLFGTGRHEIRKYWSDCVKKEFGLTDDEYVKFNETIKNKSFDKIKAENPEVAQKLQNIVEEMDVKRRAGGRNYNEWLISRPEIQGGFFWGKHKDKLTGNSTEYKIEDVPLFIREYCAQNNLPIIFFGV